MSPLKSFTTGHITPHFRQPSKKYGYQVPLLFFYYTRQASFLFFFLSASERITLRNVLSDKLHVLMPTLIQHKSVEFLASCK